MSYYKRRLGESTGKASLYDVRQQLIKLGYTQITSHGTMTYVMDEAKVTVTSNEKGFELEAFTNGAKSSVDIVAEGLLKRFRSIYEVGSPITQNFISKTIKIRPMRMPYSTPTADPVVRSNGHKPGKPYEMKRPDDKTLHKILSQQPAPQRKEERLSAEKEQSPAHKRPPKVRRDNPRYEVKRVQAGDGFLEELMG